MIHRSSIAILSLFFSFSLVAQQNSLLRFYGNSHFSEKELLGTLSGINFSLAKPDIKRSVQEKLESLYFNDGYFHFTIDSIVSIVNEDNTALTTAIYLNENSPTVIKNITIAELDSAKYSSLFEAAADLRGNVFTKQSVEALIENIFNVLDDEGYPFAKVNIVSITFSEDSIEKKFEAEIYLKVDKQREGRIERIEIVGNTKTNANVILRELNIQPHEIYSPKKTEDIPARLNRLRFFDPVEEPQFYFSQKDGGVLRIEVKEKETNNFDGVIGYFPGDPKTGGGYFSGLVNVSLRNLFGTGRAAAFRWQKIDRLSQELEVKYLEPWMFDYPFQLGLQLYQKKQDSSFVQRKYGIALDYLGFGDITLSGTLDFENVIPSLNDYGYVAVLKSFSVSTGIVLKYDTRDDPYSPTRGILFTNAFIYTKKKIESSPLQLSSSGENKVVHQKYIGDFNIYYELFKRQVAAVGLHGRAVQGSQIEIPDMFYLGGTNSLRGYRENQFLASVVAWTNLEYRFLLTRRTYLFTFFDVGYFSQKENTDLKIAAASTTKTGYGLGLHVETGLGILNVNFAFAKGDSFSEGKIHFGILNEF